MAKSEALASYVKGEDSFEGWTVSGSDEVVADDATFTDSTAFVAKYAASAVLASYNFYDGENKLTSKAIKVRGAVTFADLVQKAVSALSDTTSEELFVGWKVKEADTWAVDEMEFSESTDFEAVYREPAKYKTGVSIDDLVSYGWYSESTKTYLFFIKNGQEYYKLSKGWTAASALISEYKEKEADVYATKTSDPSYRTKKDNFDKWVSENFESGMFMGDNWQFDGETQGVILFQGFDMYTYKLNAKGNALLDENDNIIFRKVVED